ncbi:AraC family transcriptional regulator [Streptomyces indicus]|uniref:AraC-type DNA-binding protein n=1 Tax=Streptomyces indicus TaxID=417292 RepID=A0A1G9GQC6_9ACTN|nr:helix-turn-helix domain-containing protein [Streptomyces indicus]SDL02900.1 AraC-type DNA-binding protein [Streptomyces indicus]
MDSRLRRLSGPDGTWEIVEALPARRLRPGVRSYRGTRLETGLPRRRLEVPGAWVTVMLGFSEAIRLTPTGQAGPPTALTSLVSGLQTRSSVGEHDGHLVALEVVLAPWAAYRLLAVPMSELAGRHLELEDVLGARARRLSDALGALPTWQHRFVLLDRVIARALADTPAHAPQVEWAWRRIHRSAGALPVPKVAAEVGWSVRQLEKLFKLQVGLGPKAVARVARLGSALRLLAAGHPPAQVAAACGYSDQPHLNLDFRSMTGSTPRTFLRARSSLVPGPPMADRVAGQVTSAPLPA